MKTFGNSKPAAPQNNAAPAWGAPQQPQQQPAAQTPSRPAMPAMGGGLPPANPNIDTSQRGGGNFRTKRTREDEWDDAPLKLGESEFDAVVSDITWWRDGVSVKFSVHAWDREGGHPSNYTRSDGVTDTHHGRPIKWENFFALDPSAYEKAYAFWRRDLVQAYTDCGWPEDQWPKDAKNNPAPPWHLFFVHQAPDGTAVPVMLRVKVRAYDDKNGNRRVSVVSVRHLQGPVQAPMPFRIPPALAEYHRWKVAKRDSFTVPARNGMPSYNVDYVAPDNNSIALGHLSMRHYKEI